MAETETEFVDAVNQLKNQPYLGLENRTLVLNRILNDNENALKIMKIIES